MRQGDEALSRLPKIKIKLPYGDPTEYVYELEQIKNLLNFSEGVFLAEGHSIQSYDDLISIASQDKYRDREFLEVELLKPIDGG
jgi:hypothetical protein